MGAAPEPAPPPADLPAAFDVRDFRKALGRFPTGVTVVATRGADGQPIGLTCNSFASVSLAPPLVLWCLALHSSSLPAFLQAPCFSINFLSAGQAALSRQFSGPAIHRFAGVDYRPGEDGVPLIAGCAGHLECRNETRHYTGDHVIFIGRVLRYAHAPEKPLVFAEGRYCALA